MAWILIPAVVGVAAVVLGSRATAVRHELAGTLASATAFRDDVRRARDRIEDDRERRVPRPGTAGEEAGS